MTIELHGYFRSSAAYRVRIALNLKGLEYIQHSVHLRKGEQQNELFREMNPQGLVPVLTDESNTLTQSVAIIEYLDSQYREPSLLPLNELDRAYVRSIALAIACDIHPLNNLRVLNYLQNNLQASETQVKDWYRHWIATEFEALEMKLRKDQRRGKFCYGNSPTLADVCLVPQVANARRFDCDLTDYPVLVEIDARCNELEAFARAKPENQPDAD